MTVGICPGCNTEKTIKARGYCAACYGQWKRTGSTKRERQPRGLCTAPGCDKEAHGRGLCHMHLRRLKVSGNLDDPRVDNVNLQTNQLLYTQWQTYRRKDAYPIVQEWYDDFFAFMAGVGERPSRQHRLYRIDKALPMGPGNFEWREKLVTRRADETGVEYMGRHNLERRARVGMMRESELLRKYGITLATYIRMGEEQNWLCAICFEPETELRGGVLRPLCVDHDHATKKVRGLLCTACNTGIGKLRDDPKLLASAITYLVKHGRPA